MVDLCMAHLKLSQEDIDDAMSFLASRYDEFCRSDNVGKHLREDTIQMFKHDNHIVSNDPYKLLIESSLLQEPEVSYAIEKNMLSDDKE